MTSKAKQFFNPPFYAIRHSMNAEIMQNRLLTAFPGSDVIITDLTGGENHFEVRIASEKFQGQNRINQQRMVMDVFTEEFKSGELHALTIKTLVKE